MPLDCLREGIKEKNQAQLGVPHSKIQVELGLIFNFTWNPRQSRICQRNRTPLGGHGRWEGGDTAHTFRIGGTPHHPCIKGKSAEYLSPRVFFRLKTQFLLQEYIIKTCKNPATGTNILPQKAKILLIPPPPSYRKLAFYTWVHRTSK